MASDDLIANLYGPAEGKSHDTGMVMDSASLRQFQQYSFGQNQPPLCIYGDPGILEWVKSLSLFNDFFGT